MKMCLAHLDFWNQRLHGWISGVKLFAHGAGQDELWCHS